MFCFSTDGAIPEYRKRLSLNNIQFTLSTRLGFPQLRFVVFLPTPTRFLLPQDRHHTTTGWTPIRFPRSLSTPKTKPTQALFAAPWGALR
eukprot:24553-Prorocentrum_minimum.AAC.2